MAKAQLYQWSEQLPHDLSPPSFRHSRATHLATALKEAQLRQFFGWSATSNMPAVYVHLSKRDLVNTLDEYYGVKPQRLRSDRVLKTVQCKRCGFEASGNVNYCPQCGGSISNEAKIRRHRVRVLARERGINLREIEEEADTAIIAIKAMKAKERPAQFSMVE